MVKLLGELYNYKQVDSQVIFETLHLILDYGYPTPAHWGCFIAPELVDPDHDQFRLRLVCTLLDTCETQHAALTYRSGSAYGQ